MLAYRSSAGPEWPETDVSAEGDLLPKPAVTLTGPLFWIRFCEPHVPEGNFGSFLRDAALLVSGDDVGTEMAPNWAAAAAKILQPGE